MSSDPPAASPAIIVIGASAGGLRALEAVLAPLPPDFSIPVVIVLHRHAHSGEVLRRELDRCTALPVREPEDKQPLAPGCFLAPADYHLLVEAGAFALSIDAPVSHARPSVDVLFESAADAYGHRTLGVVLTGANRDGAAGVARIRAAGGTVIAQDPASAEVVHMPTAAIEAGANVVLTLAEIGAYLLRQSEGLSPS